LPDPVNPVITVIIYLNKKPHILEKKKCPETKPQAK
jgi:hypothetical protein